MLEINDLTIIINEKNYIKNLFLVLNKNDKLAIIGEEGNGKSTLLKVIAGICDYAKITGTITKSNNTLGYLSQTLSEEDKIKTVYSYLFINDNDYYDKITALYKLLETVKLSDNILNQQLTTLSGGEKVKVRILKLLLEEKDILLLDEPTNDLDIETLEWLENFIQNTSKPIIYVSHDETFLSKTANMILHLERIKNKSDCRHTLVRTTYDSYISDRISSLTKQTQLAKSEKREFYKKQDKLLQIMQKVEYQQNTISRSEPFRAALLKKKMHTLKHQEKKLNNQELTQTPDVEEEIYIPISDITIPKTKQVLDLYLSSLNVSGKVLATNIKLTITGNKHICIIGKNGIGKTTLLKEIHKLLKSRKDLKVGYMPQTYDDIFSSYQYVLDFISEQDKESITKARTALGNIKFTKEEATGKIEDLSEGSKAKLILLKLMLSNCNVLILDEPTRNVSPLYNPVIRNLLKEYKGTIISVSHDRKYINEVIDVIYELTPSGLIEK